MNFRLFILDMIDYNGFNRLIKEYNKQYIYGDTHTVAEGHLTLEIPLLFGKGKNGETA